MSSKTTASRQEEIANLTGANKKETPEEDSIKESKKTSKMEIDTSAGILSITTTIEDSKINEIVLEKKATTGSESVSSTDACNNDDIIRQSTAKAYNKNKEMTEGVTDAIKQVNTPPNSSANGSKTQEMPVTLKLKAKYFFFNFTIRDMKIFNICY